MPIMCSNTISLLLTNLRFQTMKKKDILLAAAILSAGSIAAQTAEAGGQLTSLLPDGVKANISTDRRPQKEKNLVVAGQKDKGYKAFFAATDADHGEELWVTDGTPEGTKMVKDLATGSGSSDINYLTRFNDKVVFSATVDGDTEPWISDGTEEGTYMIKNIHEINSSSPLGFTQLNEKQFIFGAIDMDSELYGTDPQRWLWVSDGTEEGTQRIYDCAMSYPGQDNNAERQSPYCRVGRRVFFKADNKDLTTGEELWVTDGTAEGTKFVKDINTEAIATGTANSALDHMTNFYNEKLFFKAWSIESGNEPWASDGTEEGTYEIYNTDPTYAASGKGNGGNLTMVGLTPYNGRVYFRNKTQEYGEELASTDCTLGDFKTFDINTNDPTNTNSSYPDPGVVFDGVYMFCANSGQDATKPNNYGGELFYTDGETVTLQSDLGPGIQCDWVKELTVVSGCLYWWNESSEDPEKQTKLYRIDNKEQFPVRVTNLSADGDRVHSLRNLGGDLLFARDDESKGLYCYHYRKDGYDPAKDTDDLDIEYRTRAEISGGVEKVAADSGVSIFPNPATTNFTVSTADTIKSVNIYNVAGSLVKSTGSEKVVSVEDLQEGLYMVVVTTSYGTYTQRVIVK